MHAVAITTVGLFFLASFGVFAVATCCWLCFRIGYWMVTSVFCCGKRDRISYRAGIQPGAVRANWEPARPPQRPIRPPQPPMPLTSRRRRRSGAGAVILTILAVGLVTASIRNFTDYRKPAPARKETFPRKVAKRLEGAKAKALAMLGRNKTLVINDSDDLLTLRSRDGVWDVDGAGGTLTDAEQDAYEKARDQIAVYLHERIPDLEWPLTTGYVREHLQNEYQPVPDKDLGGNLGSLKRVHLQVQLRPDDLRNILQQDHRFHMENRVIWLGRILAAILAVLGTLALYLRVDEASKGYYTGLLKLAAITLLLGAAASLWYVA
jgi:hypothetical protein